MNGPRGQAANGDRFGLRLACFFAVTLLLLCFAYGRALHGQPLWDDDAHLTKPSLRSLEGLAAIWIRPGATQQYYPLLHSLFWLEYRLWGNAVVYYHLANLALHAVAASCVVGILRELGSKGSDGPPPAGDERRIPRYTCWIAGLLFAFHPLCTESVAWISEQKNTLSGVFYLSAAWAFLVSRRRHRTAPYLAASLLFLGALLSKTVTSTLPAAIFVVTCWRWGWPAGRRSAFKLAPWLGVALPFGLITAHIERKFFIVPQLRISPFAGNYSLDLLQRVLLAARAALFYLGKIVWPAHLVFIYPKWTLEPGDPKTYLPVLFWVSLLAILLAIRRRSSAPLLSVLLFLCALFPALGFFDVYPFRYSYVADHFAYLAIVPAVSLIAAGFGIWLEASVGGGRPWVSRLLPSAVLAATIGALAAGTWRQSSNYRDPETLYRSILADNPSCWMAHANLGLILAQRGSVDEAIAHLREAVRLQPLDGELRNQLGTALSLRPDTAEESLAEYREAVRLSPELPIARLNLGLELLKKKNDVPAAIAEFRRALALQPDNEKAHAFLGVALSQPPNPKPDEAIAELRRAAGLDPRDYDAKSYLAILLAATPSGWNEALSLFRTVADGRPNSVSDRYNLAYALAMAGRKSEALSETRAVLRLDPGDQRALDLLRTLTRSR